MAGNVTSKVQPRAGHGPGMGQPLENAASAAKPGMAGAQGRPLRFSRAQTDDAAASA